MRALDYLTNYEETRYLADLHVVVNEVDDIDKVLTDMGEKDLYDNLLAGTYEGDKYVVEDDFIRGYIC